MVSSAMQKFFSWTYFYLFIFAFVAFALLSNPKYHAMTWSKSCHLFFFVSFMVSVLMSKSLIHFELVFVYGVKERSTFIPLPMAVQFS